MPVRAGQSGGKIQFEGCGERLIQSLYFYRGKGSNEMGQICLLSTDEFVAVYTAFVFESLVDSDRDLS